MEKIKQENRTNLPNNGFIGPTKQTLEGINHEIHDADQAIRTNAAILKKSVQQAKLQQFAEFKNDAIDELKDVNQDISKVGRKAFEKSSKVFTQSKEFLSDSTPKMTKTIGNSLKSIFKRRQSFNQKDLALLEKLAKLKQEGIITQKEFDSKKKKILAKI